MFVRRLRWLFGQSRQGPAPPVLHADPTSQAAIREQIVKVEQQKRQFQKLSNKFLLQHRPEDSEAAAADADECQRIVDALYSMRYTLSVEEIRALRFNLNARLEKISEEYERESAMYTVG